MLTVACDYDAFECLVGGFQGYRAGYWDCGEAYFYGEGDGGGG